MTPEHGQGLPIPRSANQSHRQSNVARTTTLHPPGIQTLGTRRTDRSYLERLAWLAHLFLLLRPGLLIMRTETARYVHSSGSASLGLSSVEPGMVSVIVSLAMSRVPLRSCVRNIYRVCVDPHGGACTVVLRSKSTYRSAQSIRARADT